MTSIRAAVCRSFGAPLSIESVDLRAPVQGEVEVTLGAVAICHSDISYAEGIWGGDLPAVYGHEAAGRVTGVGPGVTDLNPGTPVVVTLIRACGHCPSCASGRPVYCDGAGAPPPALRTSDGGPLVKAMNTGGFAEKVVVDRSQVVRMPEGIEMDVASLLACGVVTGIGAVVNSAAVRPGHDVVVIGAGGVGLNAVQGARIAGARRIVAVDLSDAKLAAARAFGATDGILAADPDVPSRLREILGRGADAVFITVGAIAAFDSAPALLAPGGRAYMVGMPPSGANATYLPVDMASCGQGLVGSKMGDTVIARDIPWMIDLYRQGRLKLDELIANRWPLDRINEAIADTRAGAIGRNVIVFPDQ